MTEKLGFGGFRLLFTTLAVLPSAMPTSTQIRNARKFPSTFDLCLIDTLENRIAWGAEGISEKARKGEQGDGEEGGSRR